MGKKIIFTQRAPLPVGPYSQAVEKGGILFLSGQIPTKSGDIKAQTREVLDNIKAILDEAGYGLEDVVKITIYLKDISGFGDVNLVYKEYFPKDPPSRSTVGVLSLPKGVGIEIDVIAMGSCKL